ncbi:tRNA (N6-isopentenyl adenosine(37)-C2)-methylthiotransferase MiaB [Coprothermobacteraceae bacterium]|nr:tRNA (N6-isopentenyl adenosine(37)-C2)-methylthiotransferase MiaB [Coprothermobacteraceae bacterium]
MKYYIFTYGCQMNKNDSEMISGLLEREGWEPSKDVKDADLIIINTCSVRLHAEERAIGTISALKRLGKRVVVMGCIAEVRGSELMERFPHVQAVVGPCHETEIPNILQGERQILVGDRPVDFSKYLVSARNKAHSVFVSIMKGCDDFCTYCIVPYTRGRVQSRPPQSVIDEVKAAVDNGAVEVTLLGQNVNDYGKDLDGWNFTKLVEKVAEIPELRRIRFTSPHPANFSKADIDALTDINKVMPYFHLPLQSGDDEILRLMNRKYTTRDFAELVEHIRTRVPSVAIGTDLIVAYPGETERHFEATKRFLESMRFDMVYMAIFSPRPGTPAARMVDSFVPEAEAKARYDELLAMQERISYEINQTYVGSVQEVLVDEQDKKSGKYIGRTPTNKTVVFASRAHIEPGTFVSVRINSAKSWVLYGQTPD